MITNPGGQNHFPRLIDRCMNDANTSQKIKSDKDLDPKKTDERQKKMINQTLNPHQACSSHFFLQLLISCF